MPSPLQDWQKLSPSHAAHVQWSVELQVVVFAQIGMHFASKAQSGQEQVSLASQMPSTASPVHEATLSVQFGDV